MEEKDHKLPAGRFLYDSGLLFEINRRILHPLGLALVINYDDQDGALSDQEAVITLSQSLLDYRDDPEGFIFEDVNLAEGHEKYKKFWDSFGAAKVLQRAELLGYVVQPIEGLPVNKMAVEKEVLVEEESKMDTEEVVEENDEKLQKMIERNNKLRTTKSIKSKAENFRGIKSETDEANPLQVVGKTEDKEDRENRMMIKKFIGVPHKKQGHFDKECISTEENIIYSRIPGGSGIIICRDCGRTLDDPDLRRT